jgi:hypothetical protein
MTTLKRYWKDGLGLVINTNSGEVFATPLTVVSLIARNISDIYDYINGELEGVAPVPLKDVELSADSNEDVKTLLVLDEHQILQLMYHFNPELLIECGLKGIRAYLHPLFDFKLQSDNESGI